MTWLSNFWAILSSLEIILEMPWEIWEGKFLGTTLVVSLFISNSIVGFCRIRDEWVLQHLIFVISPSLCQRQVCLCLFCFRSALLLTCVSFSRISCKLMNWLWKFSLIRLAPVHFFMQILSTFNSMLIRNMAIVDLFWQFDVHDYRYFLQLKSRSWNICKPRWSWFQKWRISLALCLHKNVMILCLLGANPMIILTMLTEAP